MTTDNFCVYLQNRLVETSQTGGQWCSDTSPLVFPGACFKVYARFFSSARNQAVCVNVNGDSSVAARNSSKAGGFFLQP
jgi:hypothetical protein